MVNTPPPIEHEPISGRECDCHSYWDIRWFEKLLRCAHFGARRAVLIVSERALPPFFFAMGDDGAGPYCHKTSWDQDEALVAFHEAERQMLDGAS